MTEPTLTDVTDPTRPDAANGHPTDGNGWETAAVAVLPEAAPPAAVIPPRRDSRMSVETLLYLLLVGLAIISRFWDLGSRALHHDESLHAYYSWLYATGHGYVHDPLMHGPFLFHANALVYLIFGASDASSRYMPALFGVFLVALPYLLRGPRHLGRWGALAASTLFLISPAFLYYSRFIRHDIYTVVGTLLLFTCIVRYIEVPQRRWLVIGPITLAFLLSNHEIIFAIAAIFALFLWGALLWTRLRPLIPLQIAAVVLAGLIYKAVPRLFGSQMPAIPWSNPTPQQQRAYYQALITNPLVIALLLLLVAYLVTMRFALAGLRDPERTDEGWMAALFGGARPGTLAAAVRNAWTDRSGLLIGIGAGAILFAALYSSLFTNLHGLATGTYATNGTLLYWLGQQNVRRGAQPWFYFLYEMPQYELFAVVFGGAATVLTLWRAGRAVFGKRAAPPRLFFRMFLVVWCVLIFGGLSMAGEKMPWLVTHISLPATLLAAALLGELIERAVLARGTVARGEGAAPRHAWAGPALVGALLIAGAGWFLIAASLSDGPYVQSAGSWRRVVGSYARTHWWFLALPPLAALVLLLGSRLWRGARPTGNAAVVALVLGLALLQVHAAFALSYEHGDVATNTLIYNTTTPDVTRVVAELGYLSKATTGNKSLDIWYDSGSIYSVEWPIGDWYLRDFTNKHPFAGPLMGAPQDAAVVLVGKSDQDWVAPYMQGYTAQEYIMRWHEPEYDIYRNFAIAPELQPGQSAWKSADQPHGPVAIAKSILSSLETQLTPQGQQRVYRFLMYREMPGVTMNYDFVIYVRNDLVPLLNQYRYDMG